MYRKLMRRTAEAMLVVSAVLLVLAVAPSPAMAQKPTNFGSASGVTCPGDNVLCNGSINFLRTELFFEPETPAFSLKSGPPTWNELEQLMDDPYLYTWGAACNDAAGPVPGNEQGYPTYCTPRILADGRTFIRRPSFGGVTLPPLLVHPLNYNPQSAAGTEMRLINRNFAGATDFQVSGTVADVFSPGGLASTGVCYTTGTSCTPVTQTIDVSEGKSRLGPGETEIDMNVALGRKLGNCQINPEPVPLIGTYTPLGTSASTAFNSESLMTCGSDPGEPGAASLASGNTNPLGCLTEALPGFIPFFGPAGFGCEDNVGLPDRTVADTSSWYSTPAVPAPNAIVGAAMQIPNGFLRTPISTKVCFERESPPD